MVEIRVLTVRVTVWSASTSSLSSSSLFSVQSRTISVARCSVTVGRHAAANGESRVQPANSQWEASTRLRSGVECECDSQLQAMHADVRARSVLMLTEIGSDALHSSLLVQC